MPGNGQRFLLGKHFRLPRFVILSIDDLLLAVLRNQVYETFMIGIDILWIGPFQISVVIGYLLTPGVHTESILTGILLLIISQYAVGPENIPRVTVIMRGINPNHSRIEFC